MSTNASELLRLAPTHLLAHLQSTLKASSMVDNPMSRHDPKGPNGKGSSIDRVLEPAVLRALWAPSAPLRDAPTGSVSAGLRRSQRAGRGQRNTRVDTEVSKAYIRFDTLRIYLARHLGEK